MQEGGYVRSRVVIVQRQAHFLQMGKVERTGLPVFGSARQLVAGGGGRELRPICCRVITQDRLHRSPVYPVNADARVRALCRHHVPRVPVRIAMDAE